MEFDISLAVFFWIAYLVSNCCIWTQVWLTLARQKWPVVNRLLCICICTVLYVYCFALYLYCIVLLVRQKWPVVNWLQLPGNYSNGLALPFPHSYLFEIYICICILYLYLYLYMYLNQMNGLQLLGSNGLSLNWRQLHFYIFVFSENLFVVFQGKTVQKFHKIIASTTQW